MLICHNKTADNRSHSQYAAPKTGLYTAANQHTKSKCRQTKSAQLFFPAHKNTPCTHCMQGVFDY